MNVLYYIFKSFRTAISCGPTLCYRGGGSNPLSSSIETLVIGPERMTCQGSIECGCLMAKNEETGAWEFFYEEIEGFTHVPGFIYTLEVERRNRGTEIQLLLSPCKSKKQRSGGRRFQVLLAAAFHSAWTNKKPKNSTAAATRAAGVLSRGKYCDVLLPLVKCRVSGHFIQACSFR